MVFGVVACLVLSATLSQQTQMFLRRARMEDQASASSGFAYHSNSNGPASYVEFSGSSGDLGHFGYPPIAIAHYTQEIPGAHESFEHYYPSHSSYEYLSPSLELQHGLGDAEGEAYKYEHGLGLHGHGLGLHGHGLGTLGEHYGSGYGYGQELDSSSFSKGGGEAYDAAKHASHGQKGESGYKSEEGVDKGSQGKHSSEDHKGFYAAKGGDKQGHHEAAEHYGSSNEAAKGSKGESFSESSGHRKGSKTTGYHKVYRKDEFKKDHSFYDESDKRGHHDKYGGEHSHHSSESGASEKGGHSDAGFHEAEQGKKGAYDKGYYDANDSKFHGQAGQSGYHDDQSSFARHGGAGSGKSFGYSEKGKDWY